MWSTVKRNHFFLRSSGKLSRLNASSIVTINMQTTYASTIFIWIIEVDFIFWRTTSSYLLICRLTFYLSTLFEIFCEHFSNHRHHFMPVKDQQRSCINQNTETFMIKKIYYKLNVYVYVSFEMVSTLDSLPVLWLFVTYKNLWKIIAGVALKLGDVSMPYSINQKFY